jgi:hypothetical protein
MSSALYLAPAFNPVEVCGKALREPYASKGAYIYWRIDDLASAFSETESRIARWPDAMKPGAGEAIAILKHSLRYEEALKRWKGDGGRNPAR